ncbi:MAG: hypothetical protein DCC71_15100, partial [Proteobacteria bacterium]
ARARGLAARARGRPAPPATRLAERFVALAERGCRVLLVFDAAEPMRRRVDEQLARDRARLDASGRFRVEVLAHGDHIFLPLASQDAVGALLERWLEDA